MTLTVSEVMVAVFNSNSRMLWSKWSVTNNWRQSHVAFTASLPTLLVSASKNVFSFRGGRGSALDPISVGAQLPDPTEQSHFSLYSNTYGLWRRFETQIYVLHYILHYINYSVAECIYKMNQKTITLDFCPSFRQMLTGFQNSFTGRLTSKFPIVICKYPTTPERHSHTTLWNITVWKERQSEICIVISDKSEGSVAARLRCGWLFSYHLTMYLSLRLVVKKFFKSVNAWQSYRQRSWLPSMPCFSCNDPA